LIVEDEEPLRLLYQEILSSEALTGRPYEVTSVESVEVGAGLLLSRPYDVLLTDYRLPGRNGIQLIEDVRAARLDTQCLLISGLVDANLVRMAYEAGALTCLRKPCSVQDLVSAVADAVSTRMRHQKQEAGELSEAEEEEVFLERIRKVLAANQTDSVFIDLGYRIRVCNSAFQEEYGDRRGTTCHEVIGGCGSPCPGCQAVAAVEGKCARVMLRLGRSPQGTKWEIEERITPLFREKQVELQGLFLSFTPILSLDGTSHKVEFEGETDGKQLH